MAGHSKFKNIQHRKGAQDKKRARIFTRLGREIYVAVKESGADANSNPRLRLAMQNARAENMPKDRIEGAIKKATDAGIGENYVPVRYEGYGVGGIAVLVEAMTDNKNRTAGTVRSAFTKYGGALGEGGSVAFMFDRLGVITYPLSKGDFDTMFEAAVEAGADDCEQTDELYEISCKHEDFGQVRIALEKKLGEANSAKLIWLPQNTISLDEEKAVTMLKLVEALEDDDDVQEVCANFEISEEIMAKIA